MRIVLTLTAIAALLAGCGTDDPSVVAEQRDLPVVVAGFWPLAEIVRELTDDAVVIDMTPVGEPAHDLPLTPRQTDEILDADLAVVLGGGFQPEVEAAAARRAGPTVDVLAGLALPDRPGDAAGPVDPHVWLDPTIMGSIVTLVADALAEVVVEEAEPIAARADEMVEDDVELDAQIGQVLKTCTRTVLVTQHESFGWFAARYGLTSLAFDATDPDADPAPDLLRAGAIEPFLNDGSVTTLFVETLTSPSWLEVIADQHGLETEVLNPYEGLTPRQDADDVGYREVMLENLEVLVEHLDCGVA